MWTSSTWFSYRRDDLENAIDKLDEDAIKQGSKDIPDSEPEEKIYPEEKIDESNTENKLKRADRAELKYSKDARFAKTLSDFRKNIREETMVESYLSEGIANHGSFEFKTEPKVKRSEGHPSHVVAHTRKMNKLGIPVHAEDDYGDTVAVRVTNTKTKASTLHHVYQRGKSGRDDEDTKRLVSVRPVGPNRPETHEHNEAIMNYLSGKRYKP